MNASSIVKHGRIVRHKLLERNIKCLCPAFYYFFLSVTFYVCRRPELKKKCHQRVYFNAEDGMVMIKVFLKISHNQQPQFGGSCTVWSSSLYRNTTW